jgi:Leucine-rich repeat (LRR) protein
MVTNAGFKELNGFKRLQSLSVSGPQVTDLWLKELAGMTSLRTLYVSNTKVTEAGLMELAGLQNLETLYLFMTPTVTDLGLKDLRKALPGCHIIR